MVKKIYTIALLLFIVTAPSFLKAQFTKLIDLNATPSGKNPVGALFANGTFLYGTTVIGGTNNLGTMYKIKPDGTSYQKLIDFDGTNNGSNPYGSFVSDGTYLYGMTQDGGAFNSGTIFKIKPDGSSYSKIYEFSGFDGANPQGTFYFDGTYLYGMTQYGGSIDYGGVVFKVKTDGTAFSVLYEFTETYSVDPWTGSSFSIGYLEGNGPTGSLLFDGANLYGLTSQGGSSNKGVIFKIDINGIYSVLHHFSGTSGSTPFGDLITDGNFLYGLTSAGGASNKGVIFSFNLNTNTYAKLYDFTGGADGGNPSATLIYDHNFLYGTASTGGVNNKGTLFKIKPNGTGFSKLFDFSGLANGQSPSGTLISDGNHLYGTAFAGGANSSGVIFKYYDLISSASQTGLTCSSQCSGYATVNISKGAPPFAFSWSSSPVQTTSTAIGLCPGNYTVTITDAYGSSTNTVQISPLASPATPTICMVTVDESSTYNVIVWNKMGFNSSDTFIVYRDISNNNYQRIGFVPYDSLSLFTDTVTSLFAANGNPNVSSWRYKLSVKDSCGNESSKSPYHQTIFIQNILGNFSWNHYQIEGQVVPVPALQYYTIYRDDYSNGNWQLIQTLSASSTAYTDLSFSTFQTTSSYRVQTIWNNPCTPTMRVLTTINTTKSNTKDNFSISQDVKEIKDVDINLFPNPARDLLHISSNNQAITNIKVYDITARLLSQLVLNHNEQTADISIKDFASGIYLAEIQTAKGIIRKQFVKE